MAKQCTEHFGAFHIMRSSRVNLFLIVPFQLIDCITIITVDRHSLRSSGALVDQVPTVHADPHKLLAPQKCSESELPSFSTKFRQMP